MDGACSLFLNRLGRNLSAAESRLFRLIAANFSGTRQARNRSSVGSLDPVSRSSSNYFLAGSTFSFRIFLENSWIEHSRCFIKVAAGSRLVRLIRRRGQ